MVLDVFGKCPQAKTISFFIAAPFDEYTKTQIAVGSEISRTTLDTFINIFLELKILIKNDNGKYELNQKSEIVRLIVRLQEKLVQVEIEKQIKLYAEGKIEEDNFTEEEIDEMLAELPDYIELNDEDTEDLILEERKELERLRNIEKEFTLMIDNLKENNRDSENKLLAFEKLIKKPKHMRY